MNLQNCTNLPPSIVREIALDLPISDVINICKTSKRCNKIVCQNNDFWYLRYQRDFSFVGEKPEQYDYRLWYMQQHFVVEILSSSGNELQQVLEKLIIDNINEDMTTNDYLKFSLLKRSYLFLSEPNDYFDQYNKAKSGSKTGYFLYSNPVAFISEEEFNETIKPDVNPVIIHNLTGNIRIFKSGGWKNATFMEDSIYKDILKKYKELNPIGTFYGEYINEKFSIGVTNVMKPKKCQNVEKSILLALLDSFEDLNISDPNKLTQSDLCYIIKHILLLINYVWFF